jgi:hypothetical protein
MKKMTILSDRFMVEAGVEITVSFERSITPDSRTLLQTIGQFVATTAAPRDRTARRLRRLELLGGGREAAEMHHLDEDLQVIQVDCCSFGNNLSQKSKAPALAST